METLVQWYAENGSALWGTIISALALNFSAIVGLVIAIIRCKVNAIAQDKKSSAQVQAITNDYIARLDAMENRLNTAMNVNTEKRIAAMQDIVNSVNEANESLKPITPIESDANAALESLD